jgi:hypothetical protein
MGRPAGLAEGPIGRAELPVGGAVGRAAAPAAEAEGPAGRPGAPETTGRGGVAGRGGRTILRGSGFAAVVPAAAVASAGAVVEG